MSDASGAFLATEIGDGPITIQHELANVLVTQPSSGTGNLGGVTVRAHTITMREVGYADWEKFSEDTSDVLEARHACGTVYFKDGTATITLTLAASTDVDFPVGGVANIVNGNSTGNIVVNEGTGTTLFVLDGASKTDSAGGATIGPGGYATLWREETTIYYLMGAGITP